MARANETVWHAALLAVAIFAVLQGDTSLVHGAAIIEDHTESWEVLRRFS
jgi:hypothetical protein